VVDFRGRHKLHSCRSPLCNSPRPEVPASAGAGPSRRKSRRRRTVALAPKPATTPRRR